MVRSCMRPGCDRPAAARLTYDTGAGAVWLDLPVEDDRPAQQVCSAHAETLTAPLGWTVTDRRVVPADHSEPRLPPPVVEGAVSPFAEARRRDRGGEPAQFTQQTLEPLDEPAEQTDAGVREPAASANDSEPAGDHGVEVAPDGESSGKRKDRPRGKLLDRAFEWTGPQHSVLTTGYRNGSRRSQES